MKDQILKGAKFSIDGEEGFFTKKVGKIVLLYKREGFDNEYRGKASFHETTQSFVITNYVGNELFNVNIKFESIKLI